MSDINSRATVTLNVNGQQAQQTLSQLRQNALNLESAMAKAAAAGNKTDLKRLRKELTDTKRQIRDIESSTLQVENVLKNLDRATPRELNKSLSTLNRQLEYIERGSAAWKAHTEKIRRVKDELAKVNGELRTQESTWERFNRKLNDWQTSIMGMVAALTGLIMAGRKAVSMYAEMDEQLTNTRKYTGMAASDVERLNEVFKKMDTRTPREKLNELAQEAGRLGKTTLEDVQGYVEAADIINVALVDLGEGATQTIAKLTNIFGVEQQLGTKEAMLSVGSAVNVLSQNCTASKPYLVEFAQRMAGVGAQAKMTIPEILAFGAVLDANGQKTEMSASALGKLTMMIFQNPTEVAKQVGLNVEEFTAKLKESTTDGVMMFLQKIHELGDKDGLAVLAPLFKDLGMDGVRMSQVLSTLAAHIDEVKWQFGEANKAFNEASSASHEYALFNNTVQAGLDKAKKRVSEMAIELGQKLIPIMRHVLTSSGMILRVLSTIVDFIVKNKVEIIAVTAAVVAYTIAVNASTIAFKLQYTWLLLMEKAQKAVAAAQALGKVVTTGLALAYEKLVWQTRGATTAQQNFNKALKAAGSSSVIGLVITMVAALGVALYKLHQRVVQNQEAARTLKKIKDEALVQAQDEINKINTLVAAARNEKLALEERQKAVNALNKIIPGYNGQLDATTKKYRENTVALKNYIAQLVRKYEIEGAQEAIKKASQEIAELRIKQGEAQQEVDAAKENQRNVQQSMVNEDGTPRPQTSGGAVAPGSVSAQASASAEVSAKEGVVSDLQAQIKRKEKVIENITNVYGTDIQKATIAQQNAEETAGGGGGGGGGSTPSDSGGGGKTDPKTDKNGTDTKGHEDKFLAEKEWKDRELAMNAIAYANGQKQYEEYTTRIDQIALEFYDKELAHTDLTEQERIKIQGEKAEELIKQKDKYAKLILEEEERSYEEQLATEKQRYIDGKISLEEYNNAVDLIELKHLQTLAKITKEGSKERIEAEKKYRDRQFQDEKKRQEEAEKKEKKIQEELKKIKEEAFGLNPQEREREFSKSMLLLQAVYDKEIAAAGDNAKEKLRIEEAFQKARFLLMKKYNVEGLRENQNFLENFNDDMKALMDSDMGAAVMDSAEMLIEGMSSIFSQLSSLIQAETEVETAALESKYEKEISLAEGNNYKVAKLEKEKEDAIAKVKNEANKKMFAMQVIQAVAQTATAALNAYSSAASIPVVGWVMAPVAAAMALAAGALQIAAIKKQQQASEAQGYAEGGFTPPGDKHKAVGVVHAGEWVASQELVNNPATRPILEALDYAQRTNTIGSLSASDVSRAITAPVVAARNSTTAISSPARVIVENTTSSDDLAQKTEVAEVLRSLNKRLSEPFITVNTVTGDTGIKRAQDEYAKLMANKSPKSRK